MGYVRPPEGRGPGPGHHAAWTTRGATATPSAPARPLRLTRGEHASARPNHPFSNRETNEALGGAGITTNPPTSSLLTDGEGRFRLDNLPEGNYTVSARLNGYRTNTTTVSVRDGETTPAVVFLEEEDEADDDTTSTADFEASVLNFTNRTNNDSSYVVVEYRARNTGDADIDVYEIYFQLLTTGQTYFEEVSGTDLGVGQSDIGEFEQYVGQDSVTAVQISDVYYDGQD